MLTEKEMLEYELISLLSDEHTPKGAVALSLLLRENGYSISSATVGRMLSEFDYQGLTIRHGFRGRTLTGEGNNKLAELKSRQRVNEVSSTFYNSVDAESKDNLIDVLIARRGIERESTRLAAINATEEDLAEISEAYYLQSKDAADGAVSADNDVIFHQAIAKASKNSVLLAAYDFIWQHGRFSPVMVYIRSFVGGVIAADHKKILDALLEKNPDKADKCMAEHIDSLISDVNKYWSMAQREIKAASESDKSG